MGVYTHIYVNPTRMRSTYVRTRSLAPEPTGLFTSPFPYVTDRAKVAWQSM